MSIETSRWPPNSRFRESSAQPRLISGVLVVSIACLLGCSARPSATDAYERWQRGGIYPSHSIAYQLSADCLIASTPATGRGDLWQIARDGTWAKVIAETPDCEVDPSISPRGDILYFSRFESGRYHIYRRTLATKDEDRVVSFNGHAFGPVALPDESGIIFIGLDSPLSASAELWRKSFSHGGLRRLTSNDVQDGAISCFRDSRRIVFCRNLSDTYLMELESGEVHFICSGSHPVISADERSVFVVRKRSHAYQWDLWEHQLESGIERAFPFDGTLFSAVCSMPDGAIAVVFDVARDDIGRIGVLDTAAGTWHTLARLLDVGAVAK